MAESKSYTKEGAEELVDICEKEYNHQKGRVISALWFIRWLYDNEFTIKKEESMHYLKISHCLPGDSEMTGYHVEAHCDWVGDYKNIAIFKKYEDARAFAQGKSYEKGLKIVDEVEEMKKSSKKQKKRDKKKKDK